MSLQIAEEGVFLLHSFLLGVCITFIYDLFRIFRRIVPHGGFWISLEDLFFWILAAIGIFSLLYYENNGAFLWFAVLGAGTGMLIYKKTLSDPFVKGMAKAVNALLALIGRILWRMSAPIRFLLKKCRILAGRAARKGRRSLRIWRRGINSRLTVWRKAFRMKLKKAKEN